MDRPRDDDFAEAYRRGYERARRSEEPTVRLSLGEELLGAFGDPAPERPVTPTAPAAPAAPSPDANPPLSPAPAAGGPSRSRPTALLVGGAAAAVVVLLGGAFGVGRLMAGGDPAVEGTADAVAAEGAGEATDDRPAYDGPVQAVGIIGSTASCQSGSSVDVAGNPVTYEPARAHDADLTTAWRCPGDGRGERLTLTLPDGTVVAQVGLVPGYAKTDSTSGEDRYAQNNRITRVRWHFDDGSSHVQRMRGTPDDRSLRTLRVPETATNRVELEILASTAGPRNTVAISELVVAEPAG